MVEKVDLLAGLKTCFDQRTVQADGRAVTTVVIIQSIHVPGIQDALEVTIPAGAEVHFQPTGTKERKFNNAIVFIGDESGSTLRVLPSGTSASVIPMLRGDLRRAAHFGERQLFPKDYEQVRQRRKVAVQNGVSNIH
jgi:hypothetical protein